MNQFTKAARIWLILGVLCSSILGEAFVNFETAPVHPVALSADGKMLAVCNLPDARVEFYDLTAGAPRNVGSLFTGIDPTTARFAPNGELWVINHISDSISIIDPARRVVVATLDCFDGPADVVFTKANIAFVSHAGANVVEIWNVLTRQSLGAVDIEGDRPKAMAISPDEKEIYVAILESGNSSTILAPPFTALDSTPQPSVVDLAEGPHGGLNPPPNFGDVFSPVINPKIPTTNAPPRVGLIVRKQNGRWLDDNKGDWTEYISGTNSFLTGRIPGWDVADHDIAVINSTNGAVRYIRGLMNICFDLSVNPATGKIALIGTDAINEVRFEPALKSVFVRSKLVMVDPKTSEATISDLNPHLDYKAQTLVIAERKQSVGDPRTIAWNSRGTRAYVLGMGSNNILMLDENGTRIGSAVELPEGPGGAVVDDARNRVYVLARFAAKLVVLDAENLSILQTLSLHDPSPVAVKIGRKHFYDTIKNSGLGQVACASCHVDGRFDRLAWDLGDQTGDVLGLTTRNFLIAPATTNSFHPMKGPMVTQTLQDIIGHEPFHWRGDRDGIELFNATFMALQGADNELTATEMQEFEDFLATLTFPPNPNRNLDNSLPTSVDLFSERALGRGSRAPGQPLPPGDATIGMAVFRSPAQGACLTCHTLPTGLGPDASFKFGRWQSISLGTNGEHHIAMVAMRRTSELPFKAQQLRNLFEKNGFDLRSTKSRSGFGFFHDGRVDTLTRFIQDGFNVTDDQETADVIAFLLALTGSDLPAGIATDINRPPGLPSRDVSAGVGFQATLFNSSSSSRTLFMMSHARSATSRVDLVVHGIKQGQERSWMMKGFDFISDGGETNTSSQVLSFASSTNPLVFTFVPRGSGVRIAMDRDGDSFFNQTEIEAGSDPADPNVTPETTTPRLLSIDTVDFSMRLQWLGRIGSKYRVQVSSELTPGNEWSDLSEPITIATNPATWSEPRGNGSARFFRVTHVP
jgi:DNA-binding beta-propeller fold protein YncE